MDSGIKVVWLLLLVPALAFYVDPWSRSDDNQDSRINSEGLYVQEEFPKGASPDQRYTDIIKRYSRQHRWWGYQSRYPWEKLPDTMCFKQRCKDDTDCCLRHNTCHSNVKVCIDCWYGQACQSEEDCCYHYPYCDRKWAVNANTNKRYISGGRCVDKLPNGNM